MVGSVICVDLDGTLISSDISVETTKQFIKRKALNLCRVLLWFCKGGVPYVKYKIAKYERLYPENLLYNLKLLSYLMHQKAMGAKLYLATGSTQAYAQKIIDHLKIFDGLFASTSKINLVGKAKANKLKGMFPEGFDYIGNSQDDVYVWKVANQKILVNPSKQVLKAMERIPHKIF